MRDITQRRRGRLAAVAAGPLGALLLGACSPAGRAGGGPPEAPAPPTAPAAGAVDSAPEDLRSLPPTATYGDLVERIATLDGRAEEAGRENCILARYTKTGAFELRVELSVAVRPAPAPPLDLDAPLKADAGLRLLSRFGALGEGELVLVELTPTRPSRSVAALLLTDEGHYLLDPSAEPRTIGPVPLAELQPALKALASKPEPVRLQVLAEAEVPLARVDDALVALQPLPLAVSLATALPTGTELPESLGAVTAPTCPEGLPEADAESGELDVEAARARLAPFAEQARVCAHEAGGRALSGGRLMLALRVHADGTVGTVCSLQDEIGEPRLLDCLRHAAARLRFPAPGGPVDLHLPVRLSPAAARVPQPACE